MPGKKPAALPEGGRSVQAISTDYRFTNVPPVILASRIRKSGL